MYRYASTPAAAMVAEAIDASDRSQREIAEAIGMGANQLSMIRRGETVLPAHWCAPAARALGVDGRALMSACLESYPDNRSWRALGLGLDNA